METRVVIVGSKGRMGRMLVARAAEQSALRVTGEVDQGDDLAGVMGGADVVIEFSAPAVTAGVAALCAARGKALVIGTTGHSDAERAAVLRWASQVPTVWSANYSTGVNALFWLVRQAASILGPGFDVEVVEMHHRMKQDAPSGTAVTLATILAEVRRQQLEAVARHGRRGVVGPRRAEEIGIHALRGGDVVGDHTVIFAANGERVELGHKASSREILADGALRAARWVVGQRPGIYAMEDVLGLGGAGGTAKGKGPRDDG